MIKKILYPFALLLALALLLLMILLIVISLPFLIIKTIIQFIVNEIGHQIELIINHFIGEKK